MTQRQREGRVPGVLEAPAMRFGILGRLQVVCCGAEVALGGHRQRAVLARLLVAHGTVVPLDTLIDDVWNERPPRTAAKTLQKYVSELRRAWATPGRVNPSQPLRTSGTGYLVDLDDATFDANEFESLAFRARQARHAGEPATTVELLRRALDLWRGEVLEDFPDLLFASWERARLGELRLTALEECLDAQLALGRHGDVIAELADLTAAHPLRERLWALRMTALAESGRAAEALRAFRSYRRTLGDELGLVPSNELAELERRIARSDVSVAFTGTVAEQVQGRSNLRAALTTFVDRRQPQRDVERAVDHRRLVTLTGTGGSGKTRLAAEYGRQARTRFPGGVWLVDLAPLGDPDRVVGAVADALEVPAQTGRGLVDTLADAIAFRPATLVLLDNCEHLTAAVAELVELLLGRCAELRILATSRSPLGVSGESVVHVPPMAPETEAAELFCDRARLARHDLEAVPGDPAVVSICRQLDGLPLAIELAASTVVTLEPEEVAARIGNDLGGVSAAPATGRQRSLRTSMEWSHALLSPGARRLFRRLGVFPGGFTLEAAEQVCSGEGLDSGDVLDVLTELVRASLVTREPPPCPTAPTRYRMLQTIRAFAAEYLARSGERQRTRAQHAAMVLGLAEAARPNVLGPSELEWRQRLDRVRDDSLVALEYAGSHEPALALRIALALWPHWSVWSRFEEGLSLLQPLLRDVSVASTVLRAWALTAAADLAADGGEARRPAAWAEEALDLFGDGDHVRGEAYALRALAKAHYNRGDFDRAAELVDGAAERFDRIDDEVGLIHVTYLLGFVHTRRGDYDQAEQTFWKALRCFRSGSRVAQARALWILGTVAQQRGDDEAARDLFEQSLEGLDERADTVSVARVHVILADLARLRGEAVRAAGLYEGSLTTLREAGDRGGVASGLVGLAAIAAGERQLDRAGDLLVEATGLRSGLGDDTGLVECLRELAAIFRASGQPLDAVTLFAAADAARTRAEPSAAGSDPIDGIVAELRSEVDRREFADAWAAGRELSAAEVSARWAARRAGSSRSRRSDQPRTVVQASFSTNDSSWRRLRHS
jgi:predicted ATPase/DNA-binding SARP family transcriptional activator